MRLSVTIPWLRWLAALPLGLILLGLLHAWYGAYAPDDNSGFGKYHGVISGRLWFSDYFPSHLEFEGRTEPRWTWATPTNYAYSTLRLNWVGRGDKAGEGWLRLPSMILVSGTGDQTPLNENWLREVLVTPKRQGRREVTDADLRLLCMLIRDMGDGRFPPPRHHPYHFGGEEPSDLLSLSRHHSYNFGESVCGEVAHHSSGWFIPYTVQLWAGLWGILGGFLGWRCLRGRRAKPTDRPQWPAGSKNMVSG